MEFRYFIFKFVLNKALSLGISKREIVSIFIVSVDSTIRELMKLSLIQDKLENLIDEWLEGRYIPPFYTRVIMIYLLSELIGRVMMEGRSK
jgi:hypothetical protein